MISEHKILNAKILIVDDQPANVLLLDEMLRDAGYTCITSTTEPTKVCELHTTHRYDLILLDLLMPVMDGFQVLEGLKQIEPEGYVPVLVITAQPDHKLRALNAGAKDFIAKPFDVVEVRTRIHNLLEVRLLYRKLERYNHLLEDKVKSRTTELRESEARFKRLAELSSDWYWEQDENGTFTHMYGPVHEMLGIQANDVRDTTTDDQSTRRIESEQAQLKANLDARKPFLDFVYSRINPDGSRQYLMVSGEPMFDPAGRFTGYCGIGRDVTDTMRPENTPQMQT